jgi:hypothetical protein
MDVSSAGRFDYNATALELLPGRANAALDVSFADL